MPEAVPVALVTGSTSGIGAAVARRLHDDGYAVVLNSVRSVDAGRALAAELGERAHYVQADVARAGDPEVLVAAAVERFGGLDVLVNNAATTEVIPHADLDAVTDELWERILGTYVIGAWNTARAAVPHLRAGSGGLILNVSSVAGLRPGGSSIPYAVSKAALNHLTRLLAATLGPEIRVNAVCPGLTETPWTATWTRQLEQAALRTPLGRVATPDDVAECCMGLLHARFVTGAVVPVDGGLALR